MITKRRKTGCLPGGAQQDEGDIEEEGVHQRLARPGGRANERCVRNGDTAARFSSNKRGRAIRGFGSARAL